MSCVHKKKDSIVCSCEDSACPRHGICCECLSYHREQNQLPACLKDLKNKRFDYS